MNGEKIYITGMTSAQNPSSGVGLSRSVRKAFPQLTIVGVDHWQGSSGLHDVSVDESLILPRWDQIDDKLHASRLKNILDDGNLWIAAMDMEVHWLAKHVGEHENLMAPNAYAIEMTGKPAVKALEGLDFRVPEWIPASLPDSEIHSFMRQSSWQCWLKSPYHEARRVSSWGGFARNRDAMSANWKTSKLFVQRHMSGNEETVAFAAYKGELLAAAHMEKRLITGEGKTWGARVTKPSPEFYEQLAVMVKRLNWSGGGEIEYMRDPDGQKWIIEWNPRFPAWMFGAALAGINLPGKLISHVWSLPLLETVPKFPFFVRVVQDIPAKESVGLPYPADPTSAVWVGDSKGKAKAGGGASMADQLPDLELTDDEDDETPQPEVKQEPVPELMLREIQQIARGFNEETPARVHLGEWNHSRFAALDSRLAGLPSDGPQFRVGYSVKTSPTNEHLALAKKHGFYAECISQAEVHRAIRAGFNPHQVILNGPGKFWPLSGKPVTGLHMLFCDSIEEFERVIEIPRIASTLGFRLRIPRIASRFGNALDTFDNFQRVLTSVRKLERKADLGFHFHMPSWSIGVKRWLEALSVLMVWCQTIQRLTGQSIRRLDLGGGFFPHDLEKLDFNKVQATVKEMLPSVENIYIEPGRALTQDSDTLISRVLDVRKLKDGDEEEVTEVVVDACVAELPLAQSFTHRVFYQPAARENEPRECIPLKKGKTRILGRICMEDDILSNGVDFPEGLKIGDLVIFGDAGGYERSMSYVFGRG